MIIAIPLAAGRLSLHFGHCEAFALIETDDKTRTIVGETTAEPPSHEPGALPNWLKEHSVNVLLAGGIGRRAQQFLAEYGIEVVPGLPAAEPRALVRDYLAGDLAAGENVCDH